MTALNPYQVYRQNDVMTAGRYELVAKLYNGALRFLSQAEKAITDKDIPTAHQALVRVQDIIAYLGDTLNSNFEVSANLAAIYDYMRRRLVEANLKKDAAIVSEVRDLVKELSATWRQAMVAAGQNGAGGVEG